MDRIVAGIDPGTRVLGLCALRVRGAAAPEPLEISARIIHELDRPARIRTAALAIEAFVRKHRPALVAIEGGYVGGTKFYQSSLAIAEVRGACAYAASVAGAVVHEASPSSWRAAIGVGGARRGRGCLKQEAQRMVTIQLRLKTVPPEDAADACGLALWMAARARQPAPF